MSDQLELFGVATADGSVLDTIDTIDNALQDAFDRMVMLLAGVSAIDEVDEADLDELGYAAESLFYDGCECLHERGNEEFERVAEEIRKGYWDLQDEREYCEALLENAEWDAVRAKQAKRAAKAAHKPAQAALDL
jgi:hypothetical protein